MSTTEYLIAADETRLLLRSWPRPAEPRASMLILHGLGEHSGRNECHNEAGGRVALAEIGRWIDGQLGPPAQDTG